MATSAALHEAQRPSDELLTRWLQKHVDLLIAERKAEQEETRILLSKCSPKELERNGAAILSLGVVSLHVGLGGKTLVELERPHAYHSTPVFPPHSLRSGDIVQIEDHEYDPSKGAKTKSKDSEQPTSGVVYRVTETKITIAASKTSGGSDTLELPSRIRVVKVANEATFDRMETFLLRLSRMLQIPLKTSRGGTKVEQTSSSESEGGEKKDGTTSSKGSAITLLISSLLAMTAPNWQARQRDTSLELYNNSLNQSQIAAIDFAMRADQFALIHGPPGTGKTTAVAELVLQMAIRQGKSVLVCGASNLAADNLLERILAKGSEALAKAGVGVTRLGHPARVLQSLITSTLDYQSQHSDEGALMKDVRKELEEALASLRPKKEAAGNKSTSSRGLASTKGKLKGNERKGRREEIKALRKEYRKRERGLVNSVLKKASIVVATCHGAGGRQLERKQFDVVIIDEACQATEAACWIPILRAQPQGKVILAGDHLQLPPTVKGFRHSQVRRSSNKAPGAKSKKDEHANRGSTTDADEDTKNGSEEVEEDDDDIASAFSALSTKAKRTLLRPPRSLETTMFSRLLGLYGPGCKALLDTQYRMNEEIMQYPNASLYEGKIKADDSCASIRLLDIATFAEKERDISQDGEGKNDDEEIYNAPLVFYDTIGAEMLESLAAENASTFQSESKCNTNEVDIVIRHIQMLVKLGLDPTRISILSPYNLQVSLLSDQLRNLKGPFEKIVVGSIDSMQGMENDVIVLSLVRSNEEKQVGFLAEKKRLNVAMTRAKRQLCVVGDSGTISDSKDPYLQAWMTFLEEHALIEPVGGYS